MQGTSNTANDKLLEDTSPICGQEQRSYPSNPPRKLLIVDDEPDGAEFAAELLRSHGLEVTIAHSADEAISALTDDKEINAVLSDITMPGMTGLELADEIRIRHPTVKIVLMSGYSVSHMLKDRESPYLFATKPYRIDSILKLLRT